MRERPAARSEQVSEQERLPNRGVTRSGWLAE